MTADALLLQPAHAIAAAVRQGDVSAEALAQASLARIERTNAAVNAFTDVTTARALATAQELDRRVQAGDVDTLTLPLLGVPYAVKNLFDVQGLTTLAGSKIERGHPPATRDGPLLQRMDAAGAVLVGALNMDEYA
ncbi:MAG: AtzE family amidohydrolase, partial [Rubrivivax sp.]